jgi:hypothetical protein
MIHYILYIPSSNSEVKRKMSPEPKYKHAIFPREQWEQIVNFRYGQRIPSEMAAIRELIHLGLKAAQFVEPERRRMRCEPDSER